MMTALELINEWITISTKLKMKPHSLHFWNARDIIENNRFNFSQEKIRKTINFISGLKETPAKHIILNKLISFIKE